MLTAPLSVYCAVRARVAEQAGALGAVDQSARRERAGGRVARAGRAAVGGNCVFLNVVFVGNVGRSWRRHGQYCARCRKEATNEETEGEEEAGAWRSPWRVAAAFAAGGARAVAPRPARAGRTRRPRVQVHAACGPTGSDRHDPLRGPGTPGGPENVQRSELAVSDLGLGK